MTAAAYPLLTALMAPCPGEEFVARYWPTQAFVAHGPPERLPALLRDPALASARELAHRYTSGRVRFTHGGSERMVQVVDVSPASLLDMGLAVQFVDVASVLEASGAFIAQLQPELGLHEGAVSLSAFAAPPGNGLVCHFDTAELISVQLAGTKRFHYAPVTEIRAPTGGQYAPNAAPFDDLYPQARHGFPNPRTAQFECAELSPGSVLFLPRGTWHYTEAGGDSLSISIAINPPAALACLLDQLRLLLLQDERWRQPLVGVSGEGPRAAQARSAAQLLLDAMPGVLSHLTADDLLRAPASLAWRMQHVDGDSRFQRTPHTRLEVGETRANGLRPLRFMTGHTPNLTRCLAEVEVSEKSVALLRWIESRAHGPFTVSAAMSAFPDLPSAAMRQVLELCVQRQFLTLLWYPDYAASA